MTPITPDDLETPISEVSSGMDGHYSQPKQVYAVCQDVRLKTSQSKELYAECKDVQPKDASSKQVYAECKDVRSPSKQLYAECKDVRPKTHSNYEFPDKEKIVTKHYTLVSRGLM